MFTRKLVKSGLASTVVAIPKEFLQDNKLRAGDSVFVRWQDAQHLIITPIQQTATKSPIIETINTDSRQKMLIEQDIIEAYITGADEITIRLSQSSDAAYVKTYIHALVAFEVVQEDSRRIIAKCYLNQNDTNVSQNLRRMEHIVGSMIDDLAKGDDRDAIIARDDEVNRLHYLLLRVLQKAAGDRIVADGLNLTPLELLKSWNITTTLEKIGDDIKRLAKNMKQITRTPSTNDTITSIATYYHETTHAAHTRTGVVLDTNLLRRAELLDNISSDDPHSASLRDLIAHISELTRHERFIKHSKRITR